MWHSTPGLGHLSLTHLSSHSLEMTSSCLPSPAPICIHELARRIDATAALRWRELLDRHRERLALLFVNRPEAARVIYLRLLFRPIGWRLAEEGLELYPRLPGGDPGEQWTVGNDRLGRHWSVAVVCTPLGMPVGTLVTVARFDSSRFGLNRKPLVFGLECVGIQTVRRALYGLGHGTHAPDAPRRDQPLGDHKCLSSQLMRVPPDDPRPFLPRTRSMQRSLR